MDPVVSKTFDEMLKRIEDYDKRWGNLERRFDDASAALQEREEAVDARLISLESFASAQSGDERDDRVETLEEAVSELQSWRMEVDGNIDDIRYDLRRLSKSTSTQPQQPPLQSRPELAAAACPGGSTGDWPSGHRVASITTGAGLWFGDDHCSKPGQCRDQHELLLRQLFNIKQTASVQEYVNQFIALVENLSAYTPNPDNLSYTTRFIDGLRPDIRAIVIVQRPQNLDTACTLALLQEEAAAAEPGQSTDIKKTEGYSFFKPPAARGPLPLPPPPPRPGGAAVHGDKKGPEDKRYPAKPPMDDRLQSLRSYRRARGLCIRCAEKWQPGHKCAPVLQLHALQEVWNLCQDEFLEEEVSEPDNSGEPAQLFMMLSTAAASSHSSARSLQLPRKIGGNDIIIFVDSGSTHSFLNTSVAMKLQGIQPLSSPVFVQVANGGQIACSQEIPMAEWFVHQHKFHSTLKVLDIGFYDMIIGMDRLQAFSPMKIHWEQKWMLIPYGSTQIALQGLLAPHGSPARGRARLAVWLLTTTLTADFTWKVGAVAFVGVSHLNLMLLFCALRSIELAPHGSPTRGRTRLAVWLLTTTLTAAFIWKIEAVAFVGVSHLNLALLFCALRSFELAPHGSPERGRARLAVCLLAAAPGGSPHRLRRGAFDQGALHVASIASRYTQHVGLLCSVAALLGLCL
ncbi:unnamed protein product [Miscanthus lutarioriparius]|uniref:Retrotransposon gag domain-containing protein n=1 Tax=Miscanthus lutarioriparius TaxID=422564 RepID=A0A811SG30_9POAL|nr:unnamed protein product [Miscanthus lutarioriparius]